MADNVTITQNANSTPPAGTIIATDEVGGVQYQIMKLATGADGVATLVSGDNQIPVTVALTQTTIVQQETNHLLQSLIDEVKLTNFLLNLMNDSSILSGEI